MHAIDRRAVLAGLALFSVCYPARAGTPEKLGVDTDDGHVVLTRYAADRDGTRPSVLILHGTNGFELKPSTYERYANALAAIGIDAYLLRYLTDADETRFKTTRERREAYEAERFDSWAKKVSSVVTTILARSDSSGRIGLLGFSLGGYVAADTAARDERITALAVMYGGMPDAMVREVKHLPPLIELHGEADRNVSPAKGEELVKLAKAIGVEAEYIGYPGKPHGFDFSDNDPMIPDALGRVVGFFEARLITATPTPAPDSPRTPPAAQP
ncbi:MAG TPA: dienelactone hydrolase family protein [Bradyrhizobium sp.]